MSARIKTTLPDCVARIIQAEAKQRDTSESQVIKEIVLGALPKRAEMLSLLDIDIKSDLLQLRNQQYS